MMAWEASIATPQTCQRPDEIRQVLAQPAKLHPTLAGAAVLDPEAARGFGMDDPGSYAAAGVIYLPATARFDGLRDFPEGGKDKKTLGQCQLYA
jgi:hypothetical protein